MSRPVTLGMVTVLLKGGQPIEERRSELLDLVDEAGRDGCQIVLLPEFADHHVTKESGEVAGKDLATFHKRLGVTIDGPWMRKVAGLAKKRRMVVIPDVMLLEGSRAFNSAVVFGPNGKVLGQYRKVHLAPGERQHVERGESIRPIETPFGKIGLLICWDINFPELTRCYELLGAEILLWTSMRQVEMENGLYRHVVPARAIEHRMPFGVATYVTDKQIVLRKPMTSTVFNAFGQVVAGGILKQGVLRATVDLDERPLDRRYWGKPDWVDNGAYLRRYRRPDLYGVLVKPLTADASDPDKEPAAGQYPDMTAPQI